MYFVFSEKSVRQPTTHSVPQVTLTIEHLSTWQGERLLLPRIRLFARTPKVASSREAAQSQSRRWLIEVFSFLEIDSFTIFKPKKGFHFFTSMLYSPSLPRWSCLSRWPVASDANDDQAVQQDANQSNLWMKRAIWGAILIKRWQFDIPFTTISNSPS